MAAHTESHQVKVYNPFKDEHEWFDADIEIFTSVAGNVFDVRIASITTDAGVELTKYLSRDLVISAEQHYLKHRHEENFK